MQEGACGGVGKEQQRKAIVFDVEFNLLKKSQPFENTSLKTSQMFASTEEALMTTPGTISSLEKFGTKFFTQGLPLTHTELDFWGLV